MGTRTEEDLLDLEILDGVAGLVARLVSEGEALAKNAGIPAFIIKALHLLDSPLAMKDLGRRLHCDPSFVTGIADTLEQRGLAARESDPGDRRVKRLVLTPAGWCAPPGSAPAARAPGPGSRPRAAASAPCLLA